MTLLQSGRALLRAVGATQRATTVEVLAATMVENPNFPGVETPDWTNPTVTATVTGNAQPVSEATATRMGLTALSDTRTLFVPGGTALTPEGRVRIANQQWRVIDVKSWQSHVEAVIERLTND